MSISFLSSVVFFFKQKTAYEMRISDWSSDVCSSDLGTSDPGENIGRDGSVRWLAVFQRREPDAHTRPLDAHDHDPQSIVSRQGIPGIRRCRSHETVLLLPARRRCDEIGRAHV